jgi:hypothetical protein
VKVSVTQARSSLPSDTPCVELPRFLASSSHSGLDSISPFAKAVDRSGMIANTYPTRARPIDMRAYARNIRAYASLSIMGVLTMAPALGILADCDCFAVRSAARHVTQLYEHFPAPMGLRITQLSILAKLERKGTINVLAVDMVMDRKVLGRSIQPRQRDGLIRVARGAIRSKGKADSLDQGRSGAPAGRTRCTGEGASTVQSRLRQRARREVADVTAVVACDCTPAA